MRLRALLRPRSVAVVGASHDPAKLGHVLLKNVLDYGFRGEIYPVNPAGGEILGRRVYVSVRALPAPPDLVLVSVPNRAVPGVIAEAASRGAKGAVILASGFGEMGGEGERLQRAVLAARRRGMRILGPNCMGIVNLAAGLNASYFWNVPRVAGGLAFISQSGAYGGLWMSELRRRGGALGTFASIGNQADVTHADLLEEIAGDRAVSAVGLFIEEVRDGRRFLAALARTARRVPVVAMKVGRTAAGVRAAASHTGSLAGDAEVCRAALRQTGAVVAETTDEFFDAMWALAAYPRVRPRARGLAILTISGGPCVAASDACEAAGVPVPELSARTQAAVRRHIPEFGAARNPVDMTPQMRADRFGPCVDAVFADPAVGGVLAINVGLDKPEYAEAFVAARAKHGKPVVGFLVDDPGIEARFREAGIPVFASPERAVRAYAALVARRTPVAPGPARPAASGRARAWDEDRSRRFLARHGVPICRGAVARGCAEARALAARIGYPVVVKEFGGGPHKTDRGGVVLDVRTPEELDRAVSRVGPCVLVEEMVPRGHELLVGARRDPTFGPVVVFGAGGVWTEHVRDVAMRVAPVDPREARAMIAETRAGARLANGARGLPKADLSAIERIVVAVSRLIGAQPRVAEVDLNPVIATGRRAVAVDALIVGVP